MYEGALFRFPGARVSSYASASRKLWPPLARGTSARRLSQFITSLTESSVARGVLFISVRVSAAFNPGRRPVIFVRIHRRETLIAGTVTGTRVIPDFYIPAASGVRGCLGTRSRLFSLCCRCR